MNSLLKTVSLIGLVSLALSCQNHVDFSEVNLASRKTSHNLAQSAPLELSNETELSIKNILVFISYPDKNTNCNGINVGSFKIVTAAHCFFERREEAEWSSTIPIDKNKMTIRFLDKSSYQLKDASTLNTKYIKSVIIHPTLDAEVEHYKTVVDEGKSRGVNFDYFMAYDIAVVELDQALLIKEKPYSEEAAITFEHFKRLPKAVEFAPIDLDPTIAQHHENFEFIEYYSLSSYTKLLQEIRHPDEKIEVRRVPTTGDLTWFDTRHTKFSKSSLTTSMKHKIDETYNGFVCYGDSGSPVFLYNRIKKNFLIFGVVQGIIKDHRFPNCSHNSNLMSLSFHYQWLGISP